MTQQIFDDAVKWSTVYFVNEQTHEVIIRDGAGNIDYRKFDDLFVNWDVTHSEREKIKKTYNDVVLCNAVNRGTLVMTYRCPWHVEQQHPYREFIQFKDF